MLLLAKSADNLKTQNIHTATIWYLLLEVRVNRVDDVVLILSKPRNLPLLTQQFAMTRKKTVQFNHQLYMCFSHS